MVELVGRALRHVALFPLLEVSQDVAGESTVWILPLRADIEMDAGQLKIVFRESSKLIVAQIRAIAERNESSVGQVVGA